MAPGSIRPRGELEGNVLDVLFDAEQPLLAKTIIERIPGKQPALTTVLTVLDRLGSKGLVRREAHVGSPLRFAATLRREDHVAQAMTRALSSSTDREAVFLQFADELGDSDVAALERALQQRRSTASGR